MLRQHNEIKDLVLHEGIKFSDERGFFWVMENSDFNFLKPSSFRQTNISYSEHKGTIRGLHFQHSPYMQSKFLTVLRGHIIDVAVDLRKGSPTFGDYCMVELSEQNASQFLIPKGFAHGFMTLTDEVIVSYLIDAKYSPESEDGIIWNDEFLSIDWPKMEQVYLSEKDKMLPTFQHHAEGI